MVAREKASLATRAKPGWSCGGGGTNQVVSAAGFFGPATPGLVAKEHPPPLATRLQPPLGLRTQRRGWGWDWADPAGEDTQASTNWPTPAPLLGSNPLSNQAAEALDSKMGSGGPGLPSLRPQGCNLSFQLSPFPGTGDLPSVRRGGILRRGLQSQRKGFL